MISRKLWIPVTALVVSGLVLAACAAVQRRASTQAAAETAQVTALTATTSVETSGTVQALQIGSVPWKTAGQVATVNVNVGDQVKAGDVLITLDPTSAPQNILQAQADLISAQQALDELLHPTALTIANAELAVAEAQDALTSALSTVTAQIAVAEAQDALITAEQELRWTQNPAGQRLYDAVADAELALQTAQANAQLANVSSDVQQYNLAVANTNVAFSAYQDLQAQWDGGDHSDFLYQALERARAAYQSALDQQTQLELLISTDQANQANAVAKAQQNYDMAAANLNEALAGPDLVELALTQARAAVAEANLADAQNDLERLLNGTDPKVALAEANLADAQSDLDKLLNGADPDDIAAAQARVLAVQAAVNSLTLTAPFDGEVLAVNVLPGDLVPQGAVAVVLANRSALHVEVPVDEADIAAIRVGEAVQVTFDPLPDLALGGVVVQINPLGEVQQGLVKYTVRVDLAQADPRVLLGMTAYVNIVTSVLENALAVPIEAVQLDDEGEYVNRVNTGRGVERVSVTSGHTQEDLVVVQGALSLGDVVEIPAPQPLQPQGPFGGG